MDKIKICNSVNLKDYVLPSISICVAFISMFFKNVRDSVSYISLDAYQLKKYLDLNSAAEDILLKILESTSNLLGELLILHLIFLILSILLLFLSYSNSKAPFITKIFTTIIVLWISIFNWLFSNVS